MKNKKKPLHYFLLLCLLVSLCVPVLADDNAAPDKVVAPTLKKAVMCEGVQDGLPVDQTIIFDVSKASAYCWSEFDPVSADGVVYHEWYRSGVLISKVKLAVHPPRWAAYSSGCARRIPDPGI